MKNFEQSLDEIFVFDYAYNGYQTYSNIQGSFYLTYGNNCKTLSWHISFPFGHVAIPSHLITKDEIVIKLVKLAKQLKSQTNYDSFKINSNFDNFIVVSGEKENKYNAKYYYYSKNLKKNQKLLIQTEFDGENIMQEMTGLLLINDNEKPENQSFGIRIEHAPILILD
jgi:hypothetical protein